MSLVKQNHLALLPDSEIVANDKNIHNNKLQIDVFPNEGSSLFGYGAASAQKQLSFTIGSANCSWLPQESHIEFDLKLAAGTTAAVTGDVSALFDRVRLVSQAGVVLLDEQANNLFQRITQTATVNDSFKQTSWFAGRQNLCVADAQQELITTTARHYAIELNQAFFKQVRSIPLPVTGNLRLIIDLAADETALVSANAACKYRIDNPRLSVALVPLTPDFQDKLIRVAQAGGCIFNYNQNYYLNAPSTSTANTLQVNFAVKSATSIIAVQRLVAQINDIGHDSLQKYQPPAGGLVTVQVRQGSDAFPSNAIDTTERAYVELLKTLNQYHDIDSGNQITRARYTAADVSVNQGSTCPLYIVGIKTAKGDINTGVSTLNGGLQLKWNCNSALAGAQIDLFVQYSVIAVVKGPNEIYLDF